MDYMKVANHPIIWFAVILNVLVVVFQSIIFVRKSLTTGRKIGLSDKQMSSALKSSAISSIGPSFVILVGLVSLMKTIGSPMAWMRLTLIGSVSHELMGVGFAADAMGTKVGSPGFTEEVFAVALWVSATGAVCWPLFTGLFTHKIDGLRGKVTGGDSDLLAIVSTAASLGAFAYLVADSLVTEQITKLDSYSYACIFGAIIMYVLMAINKKANKKWIDVWGLTIAMFGSMFLTMLVS